VRVSCRSKDLDRVEGVLARYSTTGRNVEVPMPALDEEVARCLGVYGRRVGGSSSEKTVRALFVRAGALPIDERQRSIVRGGRACGGGV
jgi:hypothetical protein